MGRSLLELSAEEGARLLALTYLDEAAAAAARLGDPTDVEALHDFRVGVRRLRSLLRNYDALLGKAVGKKRGRALRELAQSTNAGRDAEVQLLWVEKIGPTLGDDGASGVEWLESVLRERKDDAYNAVRATIHRRFSKLEAQLRPRLATYRATLTVGAGRPDPSFPVVAADAIEHEIAALIDELAQVNDLADAEIAHRGRIHGKRVRYLLTPLRDELPGAKEAVKQLKTLQDLLGDFNDLNHLAETVGQALEDAALDRARLLREAAIEGDGTGDLDRELEADERPGLLALLQRVQRDRVELFQTFLTEWRSEGGLLDALRANVLAIVERLRRAGEPEAPASEIERKYLLRALPPECAAHPVIEIDQGYLPGERLIERLRRRRDRDGERYVRTVKLGRGIVRIEVEEDCDKDVFETLWPLTEGKRVTKRRYVVPDGELAWEIDEFTDRALVIAEIELPTAETEVVLPEWLAPHVEREVTDDAEYVNANLAR